MLAPDPLYIDAVTVTRKGRERCVDAGPNSGFLSFIFDV